MNSTASKNREMARALAIGLGGRSFMIRHHNQPDSWQSGRGGGIRAKAEVRGSRSVWGEAVPSFGLSDRLMRKIQK